MYTSSPPGNERRFSKELVGEVVRSFMLTLWNTYSFFVTYANLDNWTPDSTIIPQFSELDDWLLSSLETLVQDVTSAYESFDVVGATRPIEKFVDDLSNWYLRRSRRRFWKSESDSDKAAAYETLYKALVTVSKLIAPTMPFMAETIYRNLVTSVDEDAPISVHLAEWPKVDERLIVLAQQLKCPILTNDFNLNRVAELQGIKILNINDLANAVKVVLLPGEEFFINVIQEGKEYQQGVGYLDDGTMVVIENGQRYLNKSIEVTVTKILQTSAGRMIFAKPISEH
jgi:isoleucyl-tRNA synthetase